MSAVVESVEPALEILLPGLLERYTDRHRIGVPEKHDSEGGRRLRCCIFLVGPALRIGSQAHQIEQAILVRDQLVKDAG